MKTFFSIKAGDKVMLDGKWRKVVGKSLGREWAAIRTTSGLFHVAKSRRIQTKATGAH